MAFEENIHDIVLYSKNDNDMDERRTIYEGDTIGSVKNFWTSEAIKNQFEELNKKNVSLDWSNEVHKDVLFHEALSLSCGPKFILDGFLCNEIISHPLVHSHEPLSIKNHISK